MLRETEVLRMRTRALLSWCSALLVLCAPVRVAGQATPRDETQAAARKASPHTGEEALRYFEAELAEKIAQAIKRVYDPTVPAAANPPRTPWGDPDLRGYYLTASYTPLQRPDTVTKPLYTPEEAVAAFRQTASTDASVDPAQVHYDWKEFGMDAWQSPVRPNRRTALVVDPPDGKIPPLTDEARQRRADLAARAKTTNPQTGVQIFGNLETRCLMGDGAVPLVQGGNPGSNSAAAEVTTEIQLFQTPDHVTIIHQSMNEVRIIPLKASESLPPATRLWVGNSRGRWEGNTLVVETTNFNDKTPATGFQGSTDAVQLVERFTVVDANTLRYEYTVTDPRTWTRSWSVEAPLPRIDPPLYEFACHEQNYGLINVVMGAQIRATEQGQLGGAPDRNER
jgi:hypothetical protein